MRMRTLHIALLLLTALVLSACTRWRIQEGTHAPVRVDTPDTKVRYNNVGLTDDSLYGKIAVEATNWHKNPTGTAQVWAQLRNRTDFRLGIEARTQFFDMHGAPLDKPSGWERLFLSPNTITTYRENATDPNTAFYYIEVREAR